MWDRFEFRAIGVVRSPFTSEEGTPIQPGYGVGTLGLIEVDPEYRQALADLNGFSRIWVLYVFHRAPEFQPLVVPFRDMRPRGLFATRAPARPNPIGMSVVRLLDVTGSTVRIMDVDILDGTPVLDIKPYVPEFDIFPGARAGWLEESASTVQVADRRFVEKRKAESL